jgi:hypothetical protein
MRGNLRVVTILNKNFGRGQIKKTEFDKTQGIEGVTMQISQQRVSWEKGKSGWLKRVG